MKKTILFVFIVFAIMFLPSVSNAQSISELQRLVSNLLQQVDLLRQAITLMNQLPQNDQFVVDFVNDKSINLYSTDEKLKSLQNYVVREVKKGSPDADVLSKYNQINEPIIFSLSNNFAKSGQVVSVEGQNMNSVSKVYFGEGFFTDSITSNTLNKVSFLVPQIPPDKYDLAVLNKNGLSNTTTFVLKGDLPIPAINDISPNEVNFGDEVTIKGKNFTKDDNDVYTQFGMFKNLKSSDGDTIKFVFKPETVLPTYESKRDYNQEWSFNIQVVNPNGFSNYSKVLNFNL